MPSTRNREEVSVGALSFRRFRTVYPVRSSSVNQDLPVESSDCIGGVDRWTGFLMALEMSHRVCSRYRAWDSVSHSTPKLSIDRNVIHLKYVHGLVGLERL